jgi:hypothetical protein
VTGHADEAVERLASQVILCHLALELDAVGACRAMGFHLSKARLPGQLLAVTLSASEGALQTGVKFARRMTI